MSETRKVEHLARDLTVLGISSLYTASLPSLFGTKFFTGGPHISLVNLLIVCSFLPWVYWYKRLSGLRFRAAQSNLVKPASSVDTVAFAACVLAEFILAVDVYQNAHILGLFLDSCLASVVLSIPPIVGPFFGFRTAYSLLPSSSRSRFWTGGLIALALILPIVSGLLTNGLNLSSNQTVSVWFWSQAFGYIIAFVGLTVLGLELSLEPANMSDTSAGGKH